MPEAPTPPPARRDPDALLREIERAERAERRGLLKIFLGYGEGVGKSFRLFDEGRRRKARGEDVVVAAVQPETSTEVLETVHGLEQVPPQVIQGIAVLDVPALLARRPRVCLVDGLAYDNPPGSRRPTRHEDVGDLLAAGISVLTTVNLEYIAEQQPFVREATGSAPPESVPQAFVIHADEVVVVDAPAEAARRNAEVTSVLRQRALLLTAEVVDHQLEEYLQRQGIRSTWGTQERVLVCMTPRANAARMLAAARRNVDQFHGELFAVYVVQPNLTDDDRRANERNEMLARAQSARLEVLEGRDPVRTIIEHARRRNITQIFVGHSLAQGWRARLRGAPLHRLIREADGMDVRVFPQ
jgi:two-component system, OmpR family, sensor histidine kinase KdpD